MELILVVVIMAIFACFSEVLIFKAIRYGLGLNRGENPQIFKPLKFKKPADTKEMDKYKTLLENINNYDGTGNGQKELNG